MPHATRRILIVDDQPSVLFAMNKYFGSRGYKVHCASELTDALALLSSTSYALLFVDLCLDAVDLTGGLALLAYVRRRYPQTRIVMLTAHGSPDVAAEARKRGADVFLQKPMPLPELARIAEDLIRSGEERPR